MKYEFASSEWLAALHGIIVERAETLSKSQPNLWMSTCEVFYDAPRHLADENGKVAWSCVVNGGNVDFQRRERDDIRYKVLADYDAIVPMGRYDTRGEEARAAELQRMVGALLADGKMSRPLGDKVRDADSFPLLHDAIARLTA